jgi:hypothetical protein
MSAIRVCECCGQPLPSEIEKLGERLKLSKIERRILSRLQLAGSAGILRAALVDVVYGGRKDGGPLCANNIISVKRVHLNDKLRCVGLRISTDKSWDARWRLVATEPPSQPFELQAYVDDMLAVVARA